MITTTKIAKFSKMTAVVLMLGLMLHTAPVQSTETPPCCIPCVAIYYGCVFLDFCCTACNVFCIKTKSSPQTYTVKEYEANPATYIAKGREPANVCHFCSHDNTRDLESVGGGRVGCKYSKTEECIMRFITAPENELSWHYDNRHTSQARWGDVKDLVTKYRVAAEEVEEEPDQYKYCMSQLTPYSRSIKQTWDFLYGGKGKEYAEAGGYDPSRRGAARQRGRPWVCNSCTFVNADADYPNCRMCYTREPSRGQAVTYLD